MCIYSTLQRTDPAVHETYLLLMFQMEYSMDSSRMLYDYFIRPANQRMEAMWHVVNRLPKINYDNLRYLIKFLHKLSENHTVNKMSAGNIAIVIGPNLIWPQGEGG